MNKNNCEIWGLHSFDVSLLGRFQDFKPAKQRNTPEDQYTESSHEYLQYLLVQVHVLYWDSLNSTDLGCRVYRLCMFGRMINITKSLSWQPAFCPLVMYPRNYVAC
jgi:hypothetical protein